MQHAYRSAVLLGLLLTVVSPRAAAAQENIGHPDLENPAVFERNKEPARATFYPFADRESALTRDPARSPFVRSLSGTWKFHWVSDPADRPTKFYRADFDDLVEEWCAKWLVRRWRSSRVRHQVRSFAPQHITIT